MSLKRFEDAVRQPVLTHELPDVFLAVELGRPRGQWQKRDVVWDLEAVGAMPAGLIKNQNGVGAGRDLGGDLVEMKLHGFGVAGGQHESGAGSALRAYRAEQIGRLSALIVTGARAGTFPGPAIGEFVLLADPHLILEPHLYRGAGRKVGADFRHADCEVFLNAAMASVSCL